MKGLVLSLRVRELFWGGLEEWFHVVGWSVWCLWSVPYSVVKGRQMEGGCRTYSAVRVPPWYVVVGELKPMTFVSFVFCPPSSVCMSVLGGGGFGERTIVRMERMSDLIRLAWDLQSVLFCN